MNAFACREKGVWGTVLGLTLAALWACWSDDTAKPHSAGSTSDGVSTANTTATSATNAVETAEPTAKVPIQPPPLPHAVVEILELAQKGVGDNVLIEYIKNSKATFDLTADEIVYLKDVGLSEEVIAEMLRHKPSQSDQVTSSAAQLKDSATPQPSTPESNEAGSSATIGTAPAPSEQSTHAESAQIPGAANTPPSSSSAPVYSQPVTQVNNYFYGVLAPYGTWLELPPYGWVWQPACAVVVPGWQPYCHGGYWVYTDFGWYWHSTYTWGWAPFHYGRWHRHHRIGWVWVPGYDWAPAWVVWRYTDLHCGWAPLPPGCGWSAGIGLTWYGSRVSFGFSFGLGWDCFTFVSYHHFCDRHVHRHRVPGHEGRIVYNNSTVINNYVVGDGNTIVNHGIPPSRITSVTRREIRKVHIEDVTSLPDGLHRAGQFEPRGERLAVYRPKPGSNTVPPQPRPLRTRSTIDTRESVSIRPSSALADRGTSRSVSVAKPLPESRMSMVTPSGSSPAKANSERTQPPQPTRLRPVNADNLARGVQTPERSKPGVLRPGQSNDGEIPHSKLMPVERPRPMQSDDAAGGVNRSDEKIRSTRIPPQRPNNQRSSESSIRPTPARSPETQPRIFQAGPAMTSQRNTTTERATPSSGIGDTVRQGSAPARSSPPAISQPIVTSRPKPSGPATPIPSSSTQPSIRSLGTAPTVLQPSPLQPTSQPSPAPRVSLPPVRSTSGAPGPGLQSPVSRTPVTQVHGSTPSSTVTKPLSIPTGPGSGSPFKPGAGAGRGRGQPE